MTRDPALTFPPDPSNEPTSAPLPDSTVVLPAMMSFGFFSDVSLEEPSQEEIDGVLRQTTLFYQDYLREVYPDLDSLELRLTDAIYNADQNDMPFRLHFDTVAIFSDGADAVSKRELFLEMESADYQGEFLHMIRLYSCLCLKYTNTANNDWYL